MNKVTDARISALCPVCDVGLSQSCGDAECCRMAVTDFQRTGLLDLCVVSAVKHLGPG